VTPLEDRTLRRSRVKYSKTPPKGIWDYAGAKHVSPDGCTTKQDVDYRAEMLNQVSRGWENEYLVPPKAWVTW
jgi:hypothetical protein